MVSDTTADRVLVITGAGDAFCSGADLSDRGCDLTEASEHARFSEIFARRGLTIDFGGSWLLPFGGSWLLSRLIGMADPDRRGGGRTKHHTHDRGVPRRSRGTRSARGVWGRPRPPHVQLVPTQPDSETSTITLSGPLYFTSTFA